MNKELCEKRADAYVKQYHVFNRNFQLKNKLQTSCQGT